MTRQLLGERSLGRLLAEGLQRAVGFAVDHLDRGILEHAHRKVSSMLGSSKRS